MKITICQLNPFIGDIKGNYEKIEKALKSDTTKSTDLMIFPELFLTGYPPKDLLEKGWFIEKINEYIEEVKRLSKNYPDLGILFGTPILSSERVGNKLYNSALLISNGKEIFRYNKKLLPTYDVFDEKRYFQEAEEIKPVTFKGYKIGINICEDMWNDYQLWTENKYQIDPIEELSKKGADLFINISASPYYLDKEDLRKKIIQSHVSRHNSMFIFVNQVGGNDELIFDGQSLFINLNNYVMELPAFEENITTVDIEENKYQKMSDYSKKDTVESIKVKNLHDALLLGIEDYFKKCGFKKALIGLSGGIDSAVTCAMAKRALGRENVMAVYMPGPYSSKESWVDSEELAKKLEINFEVININEIYDTFLNSLSHIFEGTEDNVAEENIQARIRGNILMAISNKFGHLLLTTGNKSELAVGYCTLYGDMSGGLGVLSDVPKTMVYQLANYINKDKEIIPNNIINKAPSAELKPDQKDEDSLPPYDLLDNILYYHITLQSSPSEIARQLNIDLTLVKNIIKMVDKNEYKRQQAPPGLKITSKAFGSGRRMPIAAK